MGIAPLNVFRSLHILNGGGNEKILELEKILGPATKTEVVEPIGDD